MPAEKLLTARKPEWLKVRAPGGPRYGAIKTRLRSRGLSTVCEEAQCPNIGECWGAGTATLMLLGSVCTRGCRFCAVTTKKQGEPVDPDEPAKVALTINEMELDYVVLTMVDRDDLDDGGAAHVARTISTIHERCDGVLVEVLVGDFLGNERDISTVLRARPEVFAHNVETTRALTPKVRDARCSFDRSLDVLRAAKALAPDIVTKSSLMLGLGETEAEVVSAMRELREAGVQILTLGQYLRPSGWHLAVEEYVAPEAFARLKRIGEEMGFAFVASGPLVRSSYRAGELFIRNLLMRIPGR
jgi:lipoic acid synthetase